jgi:phosphohistidine swiveling domain-containing protein
MYIEWLKSGQLPAKVVDDILGCGIFGQSRVGRAIVRTSVGKWYNGLDDKVRAATTFTDLKYTIERVYRSSQCPVARANKASKGISETSGIPTVLVQPVIDELYSVISRHAVRGTLTTASDYVDNINNVLPNFTGALASLVSVADRALARPVKLTLTADPGMTEPRVVSVTDETMTVSGRHLALLDLLNRGLIDEMTVLRSIEPHTLGYTVGCEMDSQAAVRVLGLPASPGSAYGPVVFRNCATPLKALPRPFIYMVRSTVPDEIDHIEECAGGIELIGGMTSHYAVLARGMGIPAVTNCGGKLDLSTRTCDFSSGRTVAEFDFALVNGSAGFIDFSPDNDGLKLRWETSPGAEGILTSVGGMLQKITQPGRFARLSIEDQSHAAALKHRLKTLGVLV